MWGILNNFEALLRHFQSKYEVFEDNFRAMEASIRSLWLFEDIFNGIESFL
jgi:hypothetical protein